jgi:hypothetical protein
MLGAYAQTGIDISRYMPILILLVFVVVIFYILKHLGRGSYHGGGGTSWKVYCFFIGIGFIAGASIISNFLNMPTMTTPILALGVLLIVIALIGVLAGLKS